jgi:ABC-2 type transport system permease protein
MNASFGRIKALVRKEVTQLWRDSRLLLLIFFLPVILLFLFAYAVTLSVDHLPTAVADQSHDERSREFLRALENSGYFDLTLQVSSEEEIIRAIEGGQAKAGVLIPPDFAAGLQSGGAQVLILLDGSDSFSVQSGYNAAASIAQRFAVQLSSLRLPAGGELPLPVVTSSRVLYNPDMDDLFFMLPGLIAMLVQNIIVAYATVAVVRERELGTMEQILITPARPVEMILAKLVPGVLVAMFDMAVVLALGVFWFRVPFRGSLLLFALLSLVFVVAYMGLGLLISTIARTQRQAQQISVLLLLFGVLLTGFIFPHNSMPPWTQTIGNLIPLTYFVRISRGIISKGIGLDLLWSDAAILLIYAVVTVVLAALLFKKRMD